MFKTILAWTKQPTTVAGISTIVGTALGFMNGSVNESTALSLVVGSLVAIALPDNSNAQKAITKVVSDVPAVVTAFETKTTVTDTTVSK